MTRPLSAAALALGASFSIFTPGIDAAQAGGPVFLPPVPAAGARIGLRPQPSAGAYSFQRYGASPRFRLGEPYFRPVYPYRGYLHHGGYPGSYAYGGYQYGWHDGGAYNQVYDGAASPYVQPGPGIIVLGGGYAARAADPQVIAAPPEANALAHGVKVLYLTDPPAEYQLQPGVRRGRARHSSALHEMTPIAPKF